MNCPRPKCTKRAMLLKLDLTKAYDRLDWSFLEAVLKCFGFAPFFVERIMECVPTPSFSLLSMGWVL